MQRLTLLVTGFAFAAASHAAAEPKTDLGVGVRIDCVHSFAVAKGANQPCATVSGLRLDAKHQVSEKTSAYIALDPFAAPARHKSNLPLVTDRERLTVTDTRGVAIADYGMTWQFRPNLRLSIKQFGGTTSLPSMSGLATASAFQDGGWDQTALVANYSLPPLAGIEVVIALGNGEGEALRNLDPQQYGGLEIVAALVEGIKLKFGLSFDGNNVGSDHYNWYFAGAPPPRVGFSADRLAAAVILDGQFAKARGLQLALGWQQNRLSDLDKNVQAVPTDYYATTTKVFDVNDILVEDPTGAKANTVERTILNLNASYQILADYFVGVDYETRTVNTGNVDFFVTDSGDRLSETQETAYTAGLGGILAEGLKASFEYNNTTYAKAYQLLSFQGENGLPQKKVNYSTFV